MELKNKSCQPCSKDSPQITAEESKTHLDHLSGWQITAVSGENRLWKTFDFPRYLECLAFALSVGQMAEEEDHHPLLEIAWGKVTVSWWTHSIGGLHMNDFILAARTESLYNDTSN